MEDPGSAGRRERSATGDGSAVPTLGVEEELTLLDPLDGSTVAAAGAVIRECREPGLVVAESMQFLVETRTTVCTTLDQVRDDLAARRRLVAAAAARHGAVPVATGVAPFGFPDPAPVTRARRYLELARRFPQAMSTNGFAGCHVHVGVPDRSEAAKALFRLRPWLPALIALTASSPIFEGEDTGWASHRLVLAARWPTAVPPPAVASEEEYDAAVTSAVARGRALDARSVYFLARLSPRYPTIEVRVADVCLAVADATAYAGLVRALVGTALREGGTGTSTGSARWLQRSCLDAARVGLRGSITDPRTGTGVPASTLVDELVEHVLPELRRTGDDAAVVQGVDALRRAGGGAERQRRLFDRSATAADVVVDLARATVPVPWTR